MTEVTTNHIKYSCDVCDTNIFELESFWSTTVYVLEFACGNCGKWHKYSNVSSKTPQQ